MCGFFGNLCGYLLVDFGEGLIELLGELFLSMPLSTFLSNLLCQKYRLARSTREG